MSPVRTRGGNRVVFPMTFERGLHEDQEESMLDTGYLTALENWIPEPSGALRARRRWQSGSITGAPATRKTRGIGTVATQDTAATPAARQTKQAQGGDVTSLAATWAQATADQSLLLAAIQAKHRPKRRQYVIGSVGLAGGPAHATATWSQATQAGSLLLAFLMIGGSAPNLQEPTSNPGGWTLRASQDFNWGNAWGDNAMRVYEIQNAGVRSGAEDFTCGIDSPSNVYAQLILVEVTGIVTVSAFENSAVSNGGAGSGTPTTGVPAGTSQPDTFAVAAIFNDSEGNNQTGPTNGFTQVQQGNASGIWQFGLYQKAYEKVTSGEALSLAAPNDRWAGAIVIYKTLATVPTITPPGTWALLNQGTLGNSRVALYAIFPASTRSGSESFTFNQNVRAELLLVEYTGVTSRDTTIDAVATGTSTAPSVTDPQLTSPTGGQKVLVLGLLGSGQVDHTAHSGGFVPLVGTDLVLHSKLETGAAAQTFGATLSASAPWIAVLEAYESTQTGSSGGYYVVAHDDGATFDILAIPRDSLMAGAWTAIDPNLAATDRTVPVAFADGLANILYTHKDFAATRRWDGTAAAAIAAAPRGRTICFYRNRFFIGGTKAGAFGSNGSTSNVSRLWFSDLGSFAVWDNLSFIDVNQDDGEPIEDIAPVGDGLLIAKRSSLWFLSGTGPDNFHLTELEAGEGYPGRCICVGPHGAMVTGMHHMWMWAGGRPEPMSMPVEGTYEVGGAFVTTGCVGHLTWVCDSGSGVMWVHDHMNNTWWTEKLASDQPACIFVHEEQLLFGPLSSTLYSLLAFREEPGSPRGRDVGIATTYRAETPELYPGGAGRSVTPRHLYLELRQRGGDSADAGLKVTPIYDGVEQAVQTVLPQSAARPFTARLDIGSLSGVKGVKLRFQQDNATMDDAAMDIERVELHGLMSPHR